MLNFASFSAGFITILVGVALWVYPQGTIYQPDKLWTGILTILFGLYVVVGNLIALWKTDRGK